MMMTLLRQRLLSAEITAAVKIYRRHDEVMEHRESELEWVVRCC